MCKLDLKDGFFLYPSEQKIQEICSISVGRQLVRVQMLFFGLGLGLRIDKKPCNTPAFYEHKDDYTFRQHVYIWEDVRKVIKVFSKYSFSTNVLDL